MPEHLKPTLPKKDHAVVLGRSIGSVGTSTIDLINGWVEVALSAILIASRLPGKSLHVFIILHALATAHKTNVVPLGNALVRAFGLDRNAKDRALWELETAGLVRVARARGRTTVVTICNYQGVP